MQFSKDNGHLYDVVAVSLDDNRVLWVDPKMTLPNAEATVAMAAARQGVEDRFFSEVPHGRYKTGDKYEGRGEMPASEFDDSDPDYIDVGGMGYPRGPRGL